MVGLEEIYKSPTKAGEKPKFGENADVDISEKVMFWGLQRARYDLSNPTGSCRVPVGRGDPSSTSSFFLGGNTDYPLHYLKTNQHK